MRTFVCSVTGLVFGWCRCNLCSSTKGCVSVLLRGLPQRCSYGTRLPRKRNISVGEQVCADRQSFTGLTSSDMETTLFHSVGDWGPLSVSRTGTPIHRYTVRTPIHGCRLRADTDMPTAVYSGFGVGLV